jgi:hypothetical protein
LRRVAQGGVEHGEISAKTEKIRKRRSWEIQLLKSTLTALADALALNRQRNPIVRKAKASGRMFRCGSATKSIWKHAPKIHAREESQMTSEAIMLASALMFAIAILINALSRYSGPDQKIAFLEAKIDNLYAQTGMTFDPVDYVGPKFASALSRGKKIEAIRLYQKMTGRGIKDSKEAVESLLRSRGQQGTARGPAEPA